MVNNNNDEKLLSELLDSFDSSISEYSSEAHLILIECSLSLSGRSVVSYLFAKKYRSHFIVFNIICEIQQNAEFSTKILGSEINQASLIETKEATKRYPRLIELINDEKIIISIDEKDAITSAKNSFSLTKNQYRKEIEDMIKDFEENKGGKATEEEIKNIIYNLEFIKYLNDFVSVRRDMCNFGLPESIEQHVFKNPSHLDTYLNYKELSKYTENCKQLLNFFYYNSDVRNKMDERIDRACKQIDYNLKNKKEK